MTTGSSTATDSTEPAAGRERFRVTLFAGVTPEYQPPNEAPILAPIPCAFCQAASTALPMPLSFPLVVSSTTVSALYPVPNSASNRVFRRRLFPAFPAVATPASTARPRRDRAGVLVGCLDERADCHVRDDAVVGCPHSASTRRSAVAIGRAPLLVSPVNPGTSRLRGPAARFPVLKSVAPTAGTSWPRRKAQAIDCIPFSAGPGNIRAYEPRAPLGRQVRSR